MKRILIAALIAAASPALVSPVWAQAPAASPPAAPAAPAAAPGRGGAQAPLQIANPRYETVSVTVAVNASADTAWARMGKFCAIAQADPATSCTYLAGNGEPGTVRSIGNEVLTSTTQYSYTYAQAPRANTPYNFQHGTLMAVPVSAAASSLNQVTFLDTSMLDASAREAAIADIKTRTTQQLQSLKALAEGARPPAASRAAAATPDQPPFQNPNPRYVAIPMQVAVNAPASVVWDHIGHFCDIGRIGSVGFPTCMIVEGTDGEYGVVRSVGREVLVGKAANSYTYSQQMRASGFYALYHGTIEARAVTPTTTNLYWTLVYDNSNQPDAAAIERDIANRRTRFMSMLQAVKTLSEGGTLPDAATAPAAAR